MLGRLAAARDAQDRLVQDAAHELRTPLTSLRTNASVLRRIAELSPDARERLLDDLQGETRELSHLVDELVELALSAAQRRARGAGRPGRVGPAQPPNACSGAPAGMFTCDADGSVVRGHRQGLERAVGNLLENAAKFDGDGVEPIELHIREGTITVSDRGPGIDARRRDARLRPLLSRRLRARPARIRVLGSRSSATSPRSTAAPSSPARGPAAARRSGSASPVLGSYPLPNRITSRSHRRRSQWQKADGSTPEDR